jgi:1,4-dihydroxy-2-naphthoyl-CoA hydrolase
MRPSEQLSELVASMPFAALLGIGLDHAEPQEVRGRVKWAAEHCTVGGLLHGGVVMTLADSVGAICAFLNLPSGASTSTIESKSNFFRGVRDGEIIATAQPLHVGRTTIVVQTDVRDASGERVALVTQTQAVLVAKEHQ